jgi:hypothetical protein
MVNMTTTMSVHRRTRTESTALAAVSSLGASESVVTWLGRGPAGTVLDWRPTEAGRFSQPAWPRPVRISSRKSLVVYVPEILNAVVPE